MAVLIGIDFGAAPYDVLNVGVEALAGGPVGFLTATIVLVAGPVIGAMLPQVSRLAGLEHAAAAP